MSIQVISLTGEINFNSSCKYSQNVLYCSINSEAKELEFAFYIEINGVLKKKFWYSKKNKIEYDCKDEIVHNFKITFFVRDKKGEITTDIQYKNTNWAVCSGIIECISLLVNDSSHILEFGSGSGSEILGNQCSIQCVEHDSRFLDLFPSISYVHAPLCEIEMMTEFNETKWYDFSKIENHLKRSYDVILVDGPPTEYGRSGLLWHLEKLDLSDIWIIDDVLRPRDQMIANYISLKLKMIQYRFWNFSVLSKKPIPNSIIERIHRAAKDAFSNESKEYISRYYPSLSE